MVFCFVKIVITVSKPSAILRAAQHFFSECSFHNVFAKTVYCIASLFYHIMKTAQNQYGVHLRRTHAAGNGGKSRRRRGDRRRGHRAAVPVRRTVPDKGARRTATRRFRPTASSPRSAISRAAPSGTRRTDMCMLSETPPRWATCAARFGPPATWRLHSDFTSIETAYRPPRLLAEAACCCFLAAQSYRYFAAVRPFPFLLGLPPVVYGRNRPSHFPELHEACIQQRKAAVHRSAGTVNIKGAFTDFEDVIVWSVDYFQI